MRDYQLGYLCLFSRFVSKLYRFDFRGVEIGELTQHLLGVFAQSAAWRYLDRLQPVEAKRCLLHNNSTEVRVFLILQCPAFMHVYVVQYLVQIAYWRTGNLVPNQQLKDVLFRANPRPFALKPYSS